MKNFIFFSLLSLAVISCGENSADSSKTGTDTSRVDTGTTITQPNPDISTSADTSSVQGKGTDKIPSRTGATGQGNTTITGSATGSPTGTGKKDSTKN